MFKGRNCFISHIPLPSPTDLLFWVDSSSLFWPLWYIIDQREQGGHTQLQMDCLSKGSSHTARS